RRGRRDPTPCRSRLRSRTARCSPRLLPRLDDDLQRPPRDERRKRLLPVREGVAFADERAESDTAASGKLDRARKVCGLHPPAEQQRELLAAGGGGGERRPVSVGNADEGAAAGGPDRVDRVGKRLIRARRLEGNLDVEPVELRAGELARVECLLRSGGRRGGTAVWKRI